jgi:probable HAF family extracellular repeat protein
MDPLVPGLPELRAALWRDGGITDLGTLEGGYESLAYAVNSGGEVAGMFTNTTADPNSMFGFEYQTRAFVWQDGVMQDLGALGGTDAWAFLLNELGPVVGWSYLSSVPNSGSWGGFPTINIATGSFICDKENGMRNLDSLGGVCTRFGWLIRREPLASVRHQRNRRMQIKGLHNCAVQPICGRSHPARLRGIAVLHCRSRDRFGNG